MGLKQIDHGTREYNQMVTLRRQILRQPLGLSFSEDELEKEKNDILIAAFDDDNMLGCCMLTTINNQTLKKRQPLFPAGYFVQPSAVSLMSGYL